MNTPPREICFDTGRRLPRDHMGNLAFVAAKTGSRRATVFRWLAILTLVASPIAIDPSSPDAGGAVITAPRLIGVGVALADEDTAERASGQLNHDGGAWRVLTSGGDAASRRPNGEWMDLAQDAEIGPATQIRVGREGQLVLSKGGDRIAMSSGAVIELEKRTPDRPAVLVRQDSGSVQYDLARGPTPEPESFFTKVARALFSTKQPDSRFEVDTPHLVVGVKGTRFRVNVTSEETRVSVFSGMVNVRSLSDRTGIDIVAGQNALVSKNQVGVNVSGEANANAALVDGEYGEASGGRAPYFAAIFIVIAVAITVVAAIAIASVIVARARWAIGAIAIRFPPRQRGRRAGDDQ